MPLKDYRCIDCGNCTEYLIRSDADVPTSCEQCGSQQIEQSLSSPGGYHISGNNSASVRPKGAGSFKK